MYLSQHKATSKNRLELFSPFFQFEQLFIFFQVQYQTRLIQTDKRLQKTSFYHRNKNNRNYNFHHLKTNSSQRFTFLTVIEQLVLFFRIKKRVFFRNLLITLIYQAQFFSEHHSSEFKFYIYTHGNNQLFPPHTKYFQNIINQNNVKRLYFKYTSDNIKYVSDIHLLTYQFQNSKQQVINMFNIVQISSKKAHQQFFNHLTHNNLKIISPYNPIQLKKVTKLKTNCLFQAKYLIKKCPI
eukprot:TRINITY_DN13291_c0_g2_i10.p2 TRINITY_DN13291_c0_g2~~TRINITY_DN13291_c0_g2_i10.p2  ORF type:complete len:239 (-),score=-7.75 TRINITY_DN13291_c0_g2_i10:59-775(-)